MPSWRKCHKWNVKVVSFSLEKAMAPHSSTLAWKIPWMEEPGRLQSVGSLRVGHDWATSLSLSCIGEGNGNPLQCSCLENPRDGRAWWAAIYGVAQSRTLQKQFFIVQKWGKDMAGKGTSMKTSSLFLLSSVLLDSSGSMISLVFLCWKLFQHLLSERCLWFEEGRTTEWNDNFDFLIHSQLVFRAPEWTTKLCLSSAIDLLIMYILQPNIYLCVCVYTHTHTIYIYIYIPKSAQIISFH